MIWDENHECMKRTELRNLQERRFLEQVSRCYKQVPFYNERMKTAGLSPQDIRSLEDISKLSFLTKDDLR